MASRCRELLEAERYPDARELQRHEPTLDLGISPEVMAELEDGRPAFLPGDPALGPNIFGAEQQTATISLQQAIASTVENNLNVEFAPGAGDQSGQVVAADAAFDWVLAPTASGPRPISPRVSSSINGIAAGVQGDQRQVIDSTVGVRKPLISGGQLSVQHQFTYTDNRTDSLSTLPDPADESNIVVQLDQPLLRNFGSDTAAGGGAPGQEHGSATRSEPQGPAHHEHDGRRGGLLEPRPFRERPVRSRRGCSNAAGGLRQDLEARARRETVRPRRRGFAGGQPSRRRALPPEGAATPPIV